MSENKATPSVQFHRDGISGALTEKVFFGNAKQQLEELWGVADFGELQNKTELKLPAPLIRYVARKIKETAQDGSERGAHLGWKDGKIVTSNEIKSNKSLYEYIGQEGVEVKISLEKFYDLQQVLISKSNPIGFHTHPDCDAIKFKNGTAFLPDGTKKNVSDEEIHTKANFYADTLSLGDLGVNFSFNRLFVSSLLSTARRHIYICPKELKIQYENLSVGFQLLRYQQEMRAINQSFEIMQDFSREDIESFLRYRYKQGKHTNRLLEILSDTKSKKDLERLRDKALASLCEKQGYMLFISKKDNKEVLERLT